MGTTIQGERIISEFERELRELINRHSKENDSDTPDFLLAQFMVGCLGVYASTTQAREHFYGRGEPLGPEFERVWDENVDKLYKE